MRKLLLLVWFLPALALAGCDLPGTTPTPVLLGPTPTVPGTPRPAPGGRIAWVRAAPGQIPGTLWVIRPDGSGATAFPITQQQPVDSIPVWSPDGTRLAYQSAQNGKDQIYVVTVKPDNSPGDTIWLTAALKDQDNTFPAWSPDGTQIVFQSGSAGAFQLYTMAASGAGQPRAVPGLPPYAGQPAWSPDGTHFAFSGGASATTGRELYTVPITGGTPLRLTANERTGAGPRWSPDGKALAFMLRQDGTESRDIYWIDANGQGLRALTDDPGDDIWPVWSPDGQWVAYFGSRGRANGNEVLVVPAAGGQSVNVSNSPAGDTYPSWAPDSTYLVFSSSLTGQPRLYIGARDGTVLRTLTPADGSYDDNFPVWSPR
jgi:TolB protein